MFRDLFSILKAAVFTLGILLSVVAVLQTAGFFLDLYAFSPAAGWAFLGAVVLLLAGSAAYLAAAVARYPKVLVPPPLPADLAEADFYQLRSHVKFQVRVLERMSRHPELAEDQKASATDRIRFLQELLKAHPLLDDLRRAIPETRKNVLDPLLHALEEKASREIRNSVRDVMLAVTLSPYHTIDLLVVLYRNAGMVLRIIRIFHARPGGREQLLILRDVFKVVVTLNFLYVGRNLVENLFSNIPLVGRAVEDMGQGLGAGLFTSAAGHAAINRCSSYQPWNEKRETENLAAQTRDFLCDVRDIFLRDVMPSLRKRLGMSWARDEDPGQGFWDSVQDGIQSSFDATLDVLDQLVVKPAAASGRGIARAGSIVAETAGKAGSLLNPFSWFQKH